MVNELNNEAVPLEIVDRVATVQKRMEAAALRSRRHTEEIKLIAVSKNYSASAIYTAYCCGLKDFGENRVQEAKNKALEIVEIRDGLTLHLVGHLQTNKVKDALKIVDIIHSVDSVHLAQEISKRATEKVPVFIEVNIAQETTKYGISTADLAKTVDAIGKLSELEIKGLMTVAPYVADAEDVRPIFRELKRLNDSFGFKQLSMGMTDDFEVAIEEGATMIRVGRAIFGGRRY